jgi:hypothetical protein
MTPPDDQEAPVESEAETTESSESQVDAFAEALAAARARVEATVEAASVEVEEASDVVSKMTREKARFQLAALILYLFATVVLAATVYAMARSDDALVAMNELLQSYVYPVVLLVLGYYFGARQVEEDDSDL